jgi:hypothetical protein
VLWLTLRGDPHAAHVVDLTPWWCISCGPAGTADQLQNLLLFLPLGVAAGLAAWTLGTTCLVLLALTIAIEGLQGILGNGRDAALGDVIANALGGLLGWWVVRLGGRRWPAVLRAAAPIGVGLFVAQLLATASLGGPASVGPEPWRVRLTPATTDRPAYRGTIITFALDGRTILTEAPKPQQAENRIAPQIMSRFTWDAGASVALSPIARLDDARGWSIASIDRRGMELGVSMRTYASRLRLRTPTWVIPVPPSTHQGDTLQLALALERGSVTVHAARANGAAVTRTMRYGAQHGWVLINPFAREHGAPGPWHQWTMAWLFGWGVLLGVCTMPTRRPAIWLGAALAALLLCTALAGAMASPGEALALVLGSLGPHFVTGSWSRRSRSEA